MPSCDDFSSRQALSRKGALVRRSIRTFARSVPRVVEPAAGRFSFRRASLRSGLSRDVDRRVAAADVRALAGATRERGRLSRYAASMTVRSRTV